MLLLAIGLVSGAISALIGGASILAFPGLLSLGLTPIEAAVVLLVALMPSGFAAAYYDREKLPPLDRSLIVMILTSTTFAMVGALLLLATPLATFKLLVPILLALATVLFAYAPRISRFIEHWGRTAGGDDERSRWGRTTLGMIPVAMYTGYFGAGVGVLLLAVLSVGSGGDYRIANALKNLLIGINNVFATIVYAVAGIVIWPVVGIMIVGTMVGAWIGTAIAKVAPRETIRIAVIVIGAALTLTYTYQFWIEPLLAAESART